LTPNTQRTTHQPTLRLVEQD